MSVEYTYDEEKNILYTRFFGVITNKDFLDQGESIGADARIKPGVRELVYLVDIEDIQASPSGFERNIQIDSKNRDKLQGMRTAVIAETDLLYGFARMYQSLTEVRDAPSTVEVFRTEKEARKWLGLDGDAE